MAVHKVVFDSDELGQIIRRSRKAQGLTLVDAAGLCAAVLAESCW